MLRIDDTDAQRNVAEALRPILDGFRWLGLDWDEGPEVDGPYAPYYQSQRGARYRAAADQLVATGAVDLAPIRSHVLPLSEGLRGFELIRAGKAVKPLLIPGE